MHIGYVLYVFISHFLHPMNVFVISFSCASFYVRQILLVQNKKKIRCLVLVLCCCSIVLNCVCIYCETKHFSLYTHTIRYSDIENRE